MDKYFDLVRSANVHNYLYHYTNLNSLRLILKNQSLRLSRIDIVNDPKENDRIKSLWNKKIYLFCLTHGQENTGYFYQNYGDVRLEFKQNEIAIRAIYSDSCLLNQFNNFSSFDMRSQIDHKNYNDASDWCVYNISTADVFYADNLDSYITAEGFENNAGLIKAKKGTDKDGNIRDWDIEEETRVRVALRPIGLEFELKREINKFNYHTPNFKYIYIRLPKINNISISPYVDDATNNKIMSVINKYRKTINMADQL